MLIIIFIFITIDIIYLFNFLIYYAFYYVYLLVDFHDYCVYFFIIIIIVILFYLAAIFLCDFLPFYYIVRFLKSEIVSSTVQTALRHLPLEYSHFDQIFTRGIQYVPPACAVNERDRKRERQKGRKSI